MKKMKEGTERTSRVTRQSSGSRRSRSSSGRSNKRSLSASGQRSSSNNERSSNGHSNKRSLSSEQGYLSSNELSSNAKKRKLDNENTSPAKKSTASVENAIAEFQRPTAASDHYCWTCHEECLDPETDYSCPFCPRIYHVLCTKKRKTHKTFEPVCHCQFTSVDGFKSTKNTLNIARLLTHVLKKVLEDYKVPNGQMNEFMEKFGELPHSENNHLLFRRIDASELVDRIKLGAYRSTNHFYQEAKWIHHNCCITLGNGHNLADFSRKFLKSLKYQLIDAEGCGECYIDKNLEYLSSDYFTKVCRVPHQIVWAKLKGFRFWPAKCLRVSGDIADISFFGTHDKSFVKLPQIYKMSKQNPSVDPKRPGTPARMVSYDQAMKELSSYISNFKERYGYFYYYRPKSPLIQIKNSRKRRGPGRKADRFNAKNSEDDPVVYTHLSEYDPVDLNVSDRLDTKASIWASSVVLERISDKYYENLIESSSDQNLFCQMTFDEENPGDINISEEIIEDSSTHSPYSDMSAQVSVNSITDSHDLSSDVSSPQITQNNSENDSDGITIISDNSPRAVSANTPSLMITSTQSLNNTFPSPESEISRIVSEGSTKESFKKVIEDITSRSASSREDDEIQVVEEQHQQQRTSVDNIFKNKPLVKTFCELLLGNKPNLRNYIASFQNMALRFYLTIWLEVNRGKLDPNESKIFQTFYEKLCRTVLVLKSQVARLKKENADLSQKVANGLAERNNNSSIRDVVIEAHVNTNVGRMSILRRDIKIARKQLAEARNTYRISTSRRENKINHLESLFKEKSEQLTEKEIENEYLKNENEVLKTENTDLKNENGNIKSKVYEQERENEAHTKENDDLKGMLDDLKRKIFDLEKNKEELMKYKEEHMSEDENLKRQIENLNRIIENLKAKVQALILENNSCRDLVTASSTEVEDLKVDIVYAEKEHDKILEEVDKIKNLNEAEIQRMKKFYQKEKLQYEKKESLIKQSLISKNDALQAEITELKNHVRDLELQRCSNCEQDNCSEGNNSIGNPLDFSAQACINTQMEVTTEKKYAVSLFQEYPDGTTRFTEGQSTIEKNKQMLSQENIVFCQVPPLHPQQMCMQQIPTFDHRFQNPIIEEMPQMSEESYVAHCSQSKASTSVSKHNSNRRNLKPAEGADYVKESKKSVSKGYGRKRK